MKNFFSKFFSKQEAIEEKEVDKVVSACISFETKKLHDLKLNLQNFTS